MLGIIRKLSLSLSLSFLPIEKQRARGEHLGVMRSTIPQKSFIFIYSMGVVEFDVFDSAFVLISQIP